MGSWVPSNSIYLIGAGYLLLFTVECVKIPTNFPGLFTFRLGSVVLCLLKLCLHVCKRAGQYQPTNYGLSENTFFVYQLELFIDI